MEIPKYDSQTAVKMLHAFVPITRFNKGEAGKIIDEVKQDGIRVVVKNNVPECVMITVEEYDRLKEIENHKIVLIQTKEAEAKRKAFIEQIRKNVAPPVRPTISVKEAVETYGPIDIDEETDKILGFLESFNNLVIDEYDWTFTGIMLQTNRQNGFTVPVTDALIAYLGIKYDVTVWTKDTHFKIIQAVYPELRLYEEK